MNNLIAAVLALGGVIIPAVGANVTGAPPGGSTKWATLSTSGSDHHQAAGTSEDLNQLALLYHRQLNQDVDKQATRRFHDVNLVYLDLYAIPANTDLYTSLLSIQIYDVIYAIRLMCVYLFLGLWPDEGFKRARMPAAGSSGWTQLPFAIKRRVRTGCSASIHRCELSMDIELGLPINLACMDPDAIFRQWFPW
ncbi:GDSL esterase/lipase EXL3-like [Panicum miliaceum]|uniref:GDSL esterase/lipase EXL3-like n=1 Tax=Panicum miliaceum TaxID=4540 RepID=A0A3L6SD85_PANMI|nr:GDSL esterase/lipase EXL3-like [Panicum miliaceum]